MSLVTVVIPVKDRRERMLACLDALAAQDHPDVEVLVLDNGSTDGTPEACAARGVRVERVPGTLGRVRNEGVRLARGDVIAFTDSDCRPEPGWLSAALRVLESDPGLGVVCGVTVPDAPLERPWPKTMVVRAMSWRFETCNAVYRAEALRAGDFDEVVGDGWEDTAAGYAVLERGWRAAFAPAALVRHDVTYPGFWHHVRREQRQANAARVIRRHPAARRALFLRVFASDRNAAFLAVAVAAATVRRPWFYALLAAPLFARRAHPLRVAQVALIEGAIHVAVLRGALRERVVLL